MRAMVSILLFALVAFTTVFVARADQNPAPTSVGISNQYVVTANGTSTKFLPQNVYRAYLMIENQGNASVIIKGDSTITGVNDGFLLAPQARWEPIPAFIDAFWVKV